MNIVILAAGMGKRMKSSLPKVLHLLGGKPLLQHVIDTAATLSPTQLCVVYGHGGEKVKSAISANNITFIKQAELLGTGHAVMQTADALLDNMPTLILSGDVPLIQASTLNQLTAVAQDNRLAILTVSPPDATGYGRIVRNSKQHISHIVEHKDASPEELLINEINTGIMVAPTKHLKRWLSALSNNNAQQEYYLTDIVGMAAADAVPIVSAQPAHIWETLGINNKKQLAELERTHQRVLADNLLEAGVTLTDPSRIDIRGNLRSGEDVTIDVNCIFEGEVTLGDNVTIDANCIIKNTHIQSGSHIRPFSHLEEAIVGESSIIGPYARLRPGANLGEGVHIGNFVEIKNSRIASFSKANHLAYVGDAKVGSRVNIGAGAITCNYDGANKHETIIDDDAFIGTNCELVAPLHVGEGATIGAGTTLSKNAPAGSLTVSRSKQTSIQNWKRPSKT